jgi:septal ring factor EnvC (AmiA/AmiB activator)
MSEQELQTELAAVKQELWQTNEELRRVAADNEKLRARVRELENQLKAAEREHSHS